MSAFRRVGLLVILILLGAALAAGAETVMVDRMRFSPDPASAEIQRFDLTVREGGTFRAQIVGRGEDGREYELELALQPVEGGSPRVVRFAFIGRGSG